MAKPSVSRIIAALISVCLVFATTPSFAATNCCDPVVMAVQMAGMAHQGTADQHKEMPCKMPIGQCASICAGMASIAFTAPQVAFPVPTMIGEPSWAVHSPSGGVSRTPALPPPIRLA